MKRSSLAQTLPGHEPLGAVGRTSPETMRATASSYTDSNASMPDAGIDALIGEVVDRRYAVEARIGEGGMGIVYRARHVHLGARVAIKVLRASLSGAADAIERLRREAQAASAIGDRHIVDVRDFGRLPDGRAYFVMEHLEGLALDEVIDDGALAWPRAVHIGEQVARALAAAHEAGIVHRDLKPENVMLIERRDDPEFVKVLDFGVAKIERAAMKITAAGTLLGTPHYMAPEQCAGASGIDHRADVYALGVMLYEMVVGVPPFDAEDLGTLLRLQAQEEPFPPSQVCELPPALEALILRCLAKRPEERFQTMREVRDAMRAITERSEGTEGRHLPTFAGVGMPSRSGATDGIERGEQPVGLETAPAVELRAAARATPVALVSPEARRAPVLAMASALVLAALGASAAVAAVWTGTDASPVPADPAPIAAPERSMPIAPPTVLEPVAVTSAPPSPPPPITLRTEPEGAAVFAGGVLLGHTPLEIPRPPSQERAEVTLRAEGFDARTLTVSWLSAPELTVPLARRARARAAPSPPPAPVAAAPPEPEAPRPRSHRELRDPWD